MGIHACQWLCITYFIFPKKDFYTRSVVLVLSCWNYYINIFTLHKQKNTYFHPSLFYKQTIQTHNDILYRDWTLASSPKKNKVSLQTNLEKNLLNLSYTFILNVNFENLTVGLHILIISFMLAKFQKDQKAIAMSSNKC